FGRGGSSPPLGTNPFFPARRPGGAPATAAATRQIVERTTSAGRIPADPAVPDRGFRYRHRPADPRKPAGPKRPTPEKLSPYECGFSEFEDARMRFDVRYYLIAIQFIIFDLEIIFIVPWATVFRELG